MAQKLVDVLTIGTLLDFKANGCKEMKIVFKAGEARGGAPMTLAPEIVAPPANKPAALDYTKADVWSLGLVLASMMTAPNNGPVVDSKKQLILS